MARRLSLFRKGKLANAICLVIVLGQLVFLFRFLQAINQLKKRQQATETQDKISSGPQDQERRNPPSNFIHQGSKVLVSYSYFEKDPTSLRNFLFFLKYSLFESENVQFVFTIQGHHSSVKIPSYSNVRVISVNNFGFHFCSHHKALKQLNITQNDFDYFIFLSSEVRGPLVLTPEPVPSMDSKNITIQSTSPPSPSGDEKVLGRNEGNQWIQELIKKSKKEGINLLSHELICHHPDDKFIPTPFLSSFFYFFDKHVYDLVVRRISCMKSWKEARDKIEVKLPGQIIAQGNFRFGCLSSKCESINWKALDNIPQWKCRKEDQVKYRNERTVMFYEMNQNLTNEDVLDLLKDEEIEKQNVVSYDSSDLVVFLVRTYKGHIQHKYYSLQRCLNSMIQLKHQNWVAYLYNTDIGGFHELPDVIAEMKDPRIRLSLFDHLEYDDIYEDLPEVGKRKVPNIKKGIQRKYNKFDSAYWETDQNIFAHFFHLINQNHTDAEKLVPKMNQHEKMMAFSSFKSSLPSPLYFLSFLESTKSRKGPRHLISSSVALTSLLHPSINPAAVPRWLVVTNGDNTYSPDFLSHLDNRYDIVGTDFYSRHAELTSVDAHKKNLFKIGDTDLGSNALNYIRIIEERRSFSSFISHGSQDGVMVEGLLRDGWKLKYVPQVLFSHSPNFWSCRQLQGDYYISIPGDSKCATKEEAEAFLANLTPSEAAHCGLFGTPSICVSPGGKMFSNIMKQAETEARNICQIEMSQKSPEDVSGIPIEVLSFLCPDLYANLDPAYYDTNTGLVLKEG